MRWIFLLALMGGCAHAELDGELLPADSETPGSETPGSETPGPTPGGTAAPVVQSVECGGSSEPETWSAGAPFQSPELHMIGGFHGGDAGETPVEIVRAGEVHLVLGAFHDARWRISVGPETTLLTVILAGFNEQTLLSIPPTATVLDWSGEGIRMEMREGWDSAQEVRAAAENRLGVPVLSFGGCYQLEGASLVQ